MNIQELATVHRLGLPVKMVIIDNKYLGMVRQWQQLFYQRNYAETDLSDNPDFVEIAKAYKIHSFRVERRRDAGVSGCRRKPGIRSTGSCVRRSRSCWCLIARRRPMFFRWFRQARRFRRCCWKKSRECNSKNAEVRSNNTEF